MSDWLSNNNLVNLVLIILALTSLIFQINSSEQSIRFGKKVTKFLGRIIMGTCGIFAGIFVLRILLSIQNKVIIDLHEMTEQLTLQFIITVIFSGSIISFFASNSPNYWVSLIKSVFASVFIFMLLLVDIVLQMRIQIVSIVILTGIVTGFFIALLLHIFSLRNNNYITITKNPFYD